MKKLLPYIFITGFIGAFLAVSFSAPFSAISLKPNVAEAQQSTDGQVGSRVVDTSKETIEISGPEAMKNIVDGKEPPPTTSNAGSGWGAYLMDMSLGYGLSMLASLTYTISGVILNMASFLMEGVISFTITNFAANIENIGVIDTGYKIILNVANMVFIFILLYMAIKMILGEGGDVKKLLAKVVMVALFINFSLFMAKAIIDASNIMSLGFLNAIKTEVGVDKETGKRIVAVGSVATAWMSGLRLQTEAYNPNADVIKNDPYKGLHYVTMTLQYLGGSALNLVTAFVFFAVSFLFVIRFVALLFYMIFSPAAFLGYISPELKEHSDRWWKGFQSQVIFAPAFLLIAYLIASVIKSNKLWGVVGGTDGPNSGFLTAIGTGFTSGLPIIMNYVILIALMIGGLITAKKMASEGSAGMVAYADKARGWMQGVAGRNTIGRAAYLAGNSDVMANIIDRSPIIGSIVKKQLDNVAGVKFGKDNKKGYSDTVKDAKKQKQKIADFVASKKTGKTDELIWNEQDANAVRLEATEVIENRLKKPKEEEKKLVENIEKTKEEIKKLEDDISKAEAKYTKLEEDAKKDALITGNAIDMTAANLELGKIQGMQRDQGILENIVVDKTRDQGILENTMVGDKTALKKLTDDMEQSTEKIKSLKQTEKTVRDALKRNYTRSLPFRSWGAEFGFLDKIFPSYVEAAEDIRKGKSEIAREVEKMIKKAGEEEAKKQTATGATTP